MKKSFFAIVAILALLIVFYGCSIPAGTASQTSESTAASQEKSANSSKSAAVSIENFAFSPDTLTVKAGTTVVWTNNDSTAHNIKIADFTSPKIAAGETFEYKFDSPGTFDYSCGIHPSMTGTIIVQ